MSPEWLELLRDFGFPAALVLGGAVAMWRMMAQVLPVVVDAIATHNHFVQSMEKNHTDMTEVIKRMDTRMAAMEENIGRIMREVV
ncbi:MAG: hypothetical protein VW405_00210 [Rhodospirillaceae bacterium]